MINSQVTVSSQTTSDWIPVDHTQSPFNLGVAIVGSGTYTWQVEITAHNVMDSTVTPVAITAPAPLDTGSSTVPEMGSITVPCRAVRLNLTTHSSGSCTMIVLQGRN